MRYYKVNDHMTCIANIGLLCRLIILLLTWHQSDSLTNFSLHIQSIIFLTGHKLSA